MPRTAYRSKETGPEVDPDTGLPRTIFLIPDANREKFEKKMASLSKRSERLLGLPIRPVFFGYQKQDLGDGVMRKVYEVLLTAEVPRVAGWTFMARLDHANETGTIIRRVPNTGELPPHFRQAEPVCEHCRVNRRRRDTYVLRCDETGEFKQVGSSCLQDFFDGQDPSKVARLAEYLGYAWESARSAEMWDRDGMADLRWIDVEEFLAHSAAATRQFGWVSAAEAKQRDVRSTRSRAEDNMVWAATRGVYPVTDEDRVFAAEALEWARGFADLPSLTEWQSNVLVVAKAEVMEVRSLGLAASIVGVYSKELARRAARQQSATDYRSSQHVGKEGERLREIRAVLVGYREVNTSFGLSYLHRFLTPDGNLLVWFGTKGAEMREGLPVTLTGTVKRHETRDSVRQTILTRCMVRPAMVTKAA
jgi:hypothetical protein